MPSEWEQAVTDLESATESLVRVNAEDFEAMDGILARRNAAIERIAQITPRNLTPALLERIRSAFEDGNRKFLTLRRVKQEMMSEWSRWNQIFRSLGGGSVEPERVDYRG